MVSADLMPPSQGRHGEAVTEGEKMLLLRLYEKTFYKRCLSDYPSVGCTVLQIKILGQFLISLKVITELYESGYKK